MSLFLSITVLDELIKLNTNRIKMHTVRYSRRSIVVSNQPNIVYASVLHSLPFMMKNSDNRQ